MSKKLDFSYCGDKKNPKTNMQTVRWLLLVTIKNLMPSLTFFSLFFLFRFSRIFPEYLHGGFATVN
jgi:hypothetical protein